MNMRPIYMGMGECRCGKLDTRLYCVPAVILMPDAVCANCLHERGFDEPEPRTADDVLSVDDKLQWKSDAPCAPASVIDLGLGHSFEEVVDAHDQHIGWLHTHPDARNPEALCQSFCAVRPFNGAPVHQVVSQDPLTLTPCLKCRTCGAHGNVTDGKWEPHQ